MFSSFEKKSKWKVLVTYNSQGTDYIVFARVGLKTGMLYFKTKMVTPFATTSYNFNSSMFDIKKGFEDLLSEGIGTNNHPSQKNIKLAK